MEERNAVVNDATIEVERGMLSAWLHLDYGGSGQGFGGYCLFSPKSSKDCAGHFIYRCLEIVGVERFDQLTGKTIRVRINEGRISAIGHIVKDLWFCPTKELIKGDS